MVENAKNLRAFLRQFVVSGHGLALERLNKDYNIACCDGCEADIDAIIEEFETQKESHKDCVSREKLKDLLDFARMSASEYSDGWSMVAKLEEKIEKLLEENKIGASKSI